METKLSHYSFLFYSSFFTIPELPRISQTICQKSLTMLSYMLSFILMRKIIFYKTIAENSPVVDFLDALSAKEAQKVTWVLRLIQELPVIPTSYFKKLKHTDGIWEVRINTNSNSYRILGFFDGNDLIVLNHAFQKKSQKTPKQAIQIAEKRKKEYLTRGVEK